MRGLYLKWLMFRGYESYRWGFVAWTLAGEVPPMFGYYPQVFMKKGTSIKRLRFKKLATDSKVDAASMALGIFRSAVKPGKDGK